MSTCGINPNAPGCKDGEQWCQDPRCEPYCTNCNVPEGNDLFISVIFFLFIILALFIMFVIFYFFSPIKTVYLPGNIEVVDDY